MIRANGRLYTANVCLCPTDTAKHMNNAIAE